jgi:hypothetical protein
MSFRLIKGMLARKLGVDTKTVTRGPLGIALGRMVEFEETPFILLDGAIDVPWPGAQCTVIAHGKMDVAGTPVHRFYLDNAGKLAGMLQVVDKEECRLFRPLDEVYPASAEEWGFWLDDDDGYIGYPQFDAKGTLYQRIWSPGTGRIIPLTFTETLEQADGNRSFARHTAMLYGRPVECAGGGRWEYLLVSAIEAGDGTAWVDLMLGLDLDPAMVKAY